MTKFDWLSAWAPHFPLTPPPPFTQTKIKCELFWHAGYFMQKNIFTHKISPGSTGEPLSQSTAYRRLFLFFYIKWPTATTTHSYQTEVTWYFPSTLINTPSLVAKSLVVQKFLPPLAFHCSQTTARIHVPTSPSGTPSRNSCCTGSTPFDCSLHSSPRGNGSQDISSLSRRWPL